MQKIFTSGILDVYNYWEHWHQTDLQLKITLDKLHN